MTFQEFQSSKKWCNDLGAHLNDARWEGELAAKGNIYLDVLYIEQVAGGWHLLIDREERVSSDLGKLEQELFAFAKSEGLTEG